MLVRTKLEAFKLADKINSGCSWKSEVIEPCTLHGVSLWRVREFNSATDKCKRCKKGNRNNPQKLACTGHTCSRCGNPYASSTRRMTVKGRYQNEAPFVLTNNYENSGIISF